VALIFAVLGSKDSGKTATAEFLIGELAKEGLRIGAIKHIHDPNFSIDTPGKDTFKFAKAGAKVTTSVADDEIAILEKINGFSGIHLQEILDLYSKKKLEVIFIEGLSWLMADKKDIYKIVTAKEPEDLARTLRAITPPIIAVTGLIAGKKFELRSINLPVINVRTEGETLLDLVKGVLEKELPKKSVGKISTANTSCAKI